MHAILPADKNPALREFSRVLTESEITSTHLKKLIADMKQLLAKEPYGVALAAVQLGEPLALFIVSGRALVRGNRNAPDESPEVSAKGDSNTTTVEDLVFINPTLTKLSRKKEEKHEGCLSIRGTWGEVPRSEKATLIYQDEHGQVHTRGASGFLAHIFQHEMDHLNGILYTDKAIHVYDEQPEEQH